MPATSRLRFRPLTGLCLLIAAACVVVAVIYLSRSADALPSFFPGHQVGSSHKHTKHGLAFIGLAVLALIGAWFTTAPAGRSGATTRDRR